MTRPLGAQPHLVPAVLVPPADPHTPPRRGGASVAGSRRRCESPLGSWTARQAGLRDVPAGPRELPAYSIAAPTQVLSDRRSWWAARRSARRSRSPGTWREIHEVRSHRSLSPEPRPRTGSSLGIL